MAKKRVRSKAEIPIDETAKDRFIRVTTPRVGKAVKAIEVIGFCAGLTYEHTEIQAKQITDVLTNAIKALEDKFSGKTGGGGGFTFTK